MTHPNHTATAEELIRRLDALPDGEVALSLRVVSRGGIARKWRFTLEEETDIAERRRIDSANTVT